METIIVGSEAQHELPNIRDTRGPSWHWDLGGASYHIIETWDDNCWDSGRISHHIMDLASVGISGVIDPVTKNPHTFESPSTLVTGWVDSRVGKIHKLFEHIG